MNYNTSIIVVYAGILREKIKGLELQKFTDEHVCQHMGWPKNKPTYEKLLDAWLKLKSNRKTTIA